MSKANLVDKRLGYIVSILLVGASGAACAMDVSQNENPSPRVLPPSFNLKPSGGQNLKWVKDREVQNNSRFHYKTIHLPKSVDFSNEIPAVHDQGCLGSCTAQAITLSMEYDLKKQDKYTQLSPLYVYYNERALEDTVDEDAGASIADGIKSICTEGACREVTWSYEDESGKYRKKPPLEAYEEGRNNFINLGGIKHSNIPHDLIALKTVLASRTPIVFGVNVYPSFLTEQVAMTGDVPMPSPQEESYGGHAMTLVGYNDDSRKFKFANSWGHEWGDKGFGYLSYDYIMNTGFKGGNYFTFPEDFWSINKIGEKSRQALA